MCVCHLVSGSKIVCPSESASLFINLTNIVACPRSTRHWGWSGELCWMCVPVLLALMAQKEKWASKQTKNKLFYMMLSAMKENSARRIWLVWRKDSSDMETFKVRQRQDIPGSRRSMCKGPEVWMSLKAKEAQAPTHAWRTVMCAARVNRQ